MTLLLYGFASFCGSITVLVLVFRAHLMNMCVKYTFYTDHLDDLGKKSLISPPNLAPASLLCEPRPCTGAGHASPSSLSVFPPSQFDQGGLPAMLCRVLGLLADLERSGLHKGAIGGLQANCFSHLPPRSEALSHGAGVWLSAVQD